MLVRRATVIGAAVMAVALASVPALAASSASPADDCSTSGDLTTLTSTGTLRGRSASGFLSLAFDSSTGVAYVPHFVGDRNVITSYQPSTHTVLRCAFDVGTNKANTHDGANVHVDSAGYLHVVDGRHGQPPLYERSAQPHDSTMTGGFVKPSSLTNDQLPLPGATYPQLYSNPADPNQLIVVAREKTPPGNAKVEMITSTDHGDTWSPAQTIFDYTDLDLAAKVYPELVEAPDASLHLVLSPHREMHAGECGPYDNRTIYYATSKDFGATWSKADGTPIALPITDANADHVVTATTAGQRIQAHLGTPVAFDAQNNPIIFYRKWRDPNCTKLENTPAQLAEVRWDGTEWTAPRLIEDARAVTEYAVAQLNPAREVIEVYATRVYHKVPILVVYQSRDYGATWSGLECLNTVTTASPITWQSANQTQADEDLIEYGSGPAGYLLDRSNGGGGQQSCPWPT